MVFDDLAMRAAGGASKKIAVVLPWGINMWFPVSFP